MADEIVVGATRKNLVATIVDSDGAVVNLTGGTVRMQGRCASLSGKTIDVAGVITDPAQGKVTFSALGSLVTQAELTAAALTEAIFTLRLKYTDVAALIDFGESFELKWIHDPTVLA